jgi:hypothetical protein
MDRNLMAHLTVMDAVLENCGGDLCKFDESIYVIAEQNYNMTTSRTDYTPDELFDVLAAKEHENSLK